MLLVLEPLLEANAINRVLKALEDMGLKAELLESADHIAVYVRSDVRSLPAHRFSQLNGVERVIRISPSCPLTLSDVDRAIKVSADSDAQGQVTIGGGALPVLMAGPCSVEGREQIVELARRVKNAGATVLRGGAFKPRTSPYEFGGLGREALACLAEARRVTGLPVVSEVMSLEQVSVAVEYVDMLQIGARNMYNYELLKEVGGQGKPVLIKRGMSATIDEYLQAVEYVMLSGNRQVVLCERGIRTFEPRTRNTLDLSAVPLLKSLTGLPVIVDPSHATGKRSLVRPMSRAAIACGADGLMIEVHCQPDKSVSDAEQAIDPAELARIAGDMSVLCESLSAIDQGLAASVCDDTGGDARARLVVACATSSS